jgi:1,2-diacylglycerol 3-alpha-glucosyltransferase
MKTYLPARPNVRFLIVGDGPAKNELEAMSFDFGISDRVIFAGEQPYDEIPDFYRLGHVFVSASQSETQGLTYIEALAAGLPVVAKADRCLEDTLYNGVNGYTFHNASEAEQALDKLLFDDARRGETSARAALSVRKFSAESFARAVGFVYSDAAAMRAKPQKESKACCADAVTAGLTTV